MPGHVTDELEQHRYRRYIIGALELAGSFEKQLAFRDRVPIASASAEVILKWSDVYHDDAPDAYTPPIYSMQEVDAMRAFHAAWLKVCDQTPDRLPSLEVLFGSPEWLLLRDAANEALSVFAVRGWETEPEPTVR